MKLVDNSGYDPDAWNLTSLTEQQNLATGPDGKTSATRYAQTTSGDLIMVNTISCTEIMSKTNVTAHFCVRAVTAISSLTVQILDTNGVLAWHQSTIGIDEDWTRFAISCDPTSTALAGRDHFRFALRTTLPGPVSRWDVYGLHFTWDDGDGNPVNHADLPIEYDYKNELKKIEQTHRSRSGRRYVYTWAEYERLKFGVKYVSSSGQSLVNSWYRNNTKLIYSETDSASIITSCQLVGRKVPIGQFVKPYNDLYKGVIELESY